MQNDKPGRAKSDSSNSRKADEVRHRLQYVCGVCFGGNEARFAEVAGYRHRLSYFKSVLRGPLTPTLNFVGNVVKSGVVSADFLLCGVGAPLCVMQDDEDATAVQLQNPDGCFDTSAVRYATESERVQPVFQGLPRFDALLPVARAVYAARSANKPVVGFVPAQTILRGDASAVIELLRKKYLTAVVLSSAAVVRDVELARFGGCAKTTPLAQQLIDINDAARLAASSGTGYGEMLGRCCFLNNSYRDLSVLAAAYDVGATALVHGALGDGINHWFPAVGGAKLGAALGAACYTDMLIFGGTIAACFGSPAGVYISPDYRGQALFQNAVAANQTHCDETAPRSLVLSAYATNKTTNTFHALLAACDAAYTTD